MFNSGSNSFFPLAQVSLEASNLGFDSLLWIGPGLPVGVCIKVLLPQILNVLVEILDLLLHYVYLRKELEEVVVQHLAQVRWLGAIG